MEKREEQNANESPLVWDTRTRKKSRQDSVAMNYGFNGEITIKTEDKKGEVQKKKKKRIEQLEESVANLESENLLLRLQLRVGKDAMHRDAQEKLEVTQKLEKLIEAEAPDEEVSAVIGTYVTKFSDYGEDRSDTIHRHMEQLSRLLQPTRLTKMFMWSLHQDDEFNEESRTGSDLNSGFDTTIGHPLESRKSTWSVILDEIKASSDQIKRFDDYKNDTRKMAKDLRFTLREFEDLRRLLDRKNSAFRDELKNLQTILTPKQLAKFILWIHKNPANMSMLSSLWSPVDDAPGSQQGYS